jgi:hypothetical protein
MSLQDAHSRHQFTQPTNIDKLLLARQRIPRQLPGITGAWHYLVGYIQQQYYVPGWMCGTDWDLPPPGCGRPGWTPFSDLLDRGRAELGPCQDDPRRAGHGQLIQHPDAWITDFTTYSGGDVTNGHADMSRRFDTARRIAYIGEGLA